jgi:hypothetical protein
MGNLEKMQVIGDIISYFSPIILIVALKREQKSDWEKIYNIFSPCLYFFPIRPSINCSTFRDGVIGGKYGKREINSYNV